MDESEEESIKESKEKIKFRLKDDLIIKDNWNLKSQFEYTLKQYKKNQS